MAFRIEFTKSAAREFSKLPRAVQGKVQDALHLLSANPFSELIRVKKLKGAASLYRVRIGDYRIVYEIRNEILTIIVIKIGNRKDVYRNL